MMSDTARNRVEPPIPFIDLGAQRHRLGSRIDDAVLRVLDHGNYIMGPEIGALEAALSDFCGAGRSISCSNGTDALALALMVKKVRPGQAVLVPSFTFAATAEVVAWFGATALFVDVLEDCFTMDPASLEAGVAAARRLGLDPVGVNRPITTRCIRSPPHISSGLFPTRHKASAPDTRAGLWEHWPRFPRPASFRPSRWVVMAMAVRFSPTVTISPQRL